MALSFSFDKEKLLSLPRRLKLAWLVIGGGIVFSVGAYLLNTALNDQEVAVAQLRGQLGQLRQQSTDLRRRVDQYPELRQHYELAVKNGILAPQDRVGLVNDAQDMANRYHLAELRYKLEPQNARVGPVGKFQVGATLVSLESGALLDTDAMAFWDELLAGLPSHYQVTEASLERVADINGAVVNAIHAGQSVSTVRMRLAFRWVAMHPAAQDTP